MARMNEGGWKLSCTAPICADMEITDMPFLDHQLALILKSALADICKRIMKGLTALYRSKDSHNWIPKLLASYILLHSWQMLMKQQREMAIERGLEVSD